MQDKWEQVLIKDAVLAYTKEKSRQRIWNIAKWMIIILIGFWVSYSSKSNHDANSDPKNFPHIAVIEINDLIIDQHHNNQVYNQIKSAFENAKSKGVLFLIDSTGGSPHTAYKIYYEIMHYKNKYPNKFSYAVVDSFCASAAYLIACSCDQIIAAPTSIVGSIGVVSPNFNYAGLAEKVGIKDTTIATSEIKYSSPINPETEANIMKKKYLIKNLFDIFKNIVRESRGSKLIDEKLVFDASVWLGQDALELGLTDKVGTLTMIKEEFSDLEIVPYEHTPNLQEKLENLINSSYKLTASASKVYNTFANMMLL